MSGVSLPVTRPTGRALVVASPAGRAQPAGAMRALGFDCSESDDPYAAMAELARRPLVYRALVLSLAGFYREELELIRTVKRRFPHLDVWMTQTDGRQASLAEAMRLGADGLLAEEGLHRVALASPSHDPLPRAPSMGTSLSMPPASPASETRDSEDHFDPRFDGPVLSAEELKALLQEQPSFPPSDGGD